LREILQSIRKFLNEQFTLDEDKADEGLIIESINRNVAFKGTNLWTLVFAILIASIGLNVNSTAVVIGAMLISPLMGPIMGIGLGIGIYDFNLMKRGIKNLLIAAVFSIITSFIYFSLSPLHEAKTELLARTTPSIWDVLIAFFGGMAGIIAGTRKEKSNILPGVAIATALMPPLCTAGFALATGKMYFFLGAVYLFFINSLFICLATFIIVRYLKFKTTKYASVSQQKKVVRYIWIIVTLTILPSIYLAFRIVQKTIFEENARQFIQTEFRFANTQVINHTLKFNQPNHIIDLLLIGDELDTQTIDSLKSRMTKYNLNKTELKIRQGLDAKNEVDLAQIKASILEDVFNSKSVLDTVQKKINKIDRKLPDLKAELVSLYPQITDFVLSNTVIVSAASTRQDTVTLFVATFLNRLEEQDKVKMANWLRQRINTDSLRVILQTVPVTKKK